MADWITIDPTSGCNDGSVSFTASKNTTDTERSSKYRIYNDDYGIEKYISVIQSYPYLRIVPDNYTMDYNGGTGSFKIETSLTSTYISSNSDWLTVDGTTFSVTEWKGNADRVGKISVTGTFNSSSYIDKLYVYQKCLALPIVLSVDKSSFDWEGGTFTLTVECGGAWALKAPAAVHLDTYEGFGNTTISGALSYNFKDSEESFDITGNSGGKYYDTVSLSQDYGLDTTLHTVYKYNALGTVGYYKGYKNGTEITYQHLHNPYSLDAAVIWDDIIDSVELRYYTIGDTDYEGSAVYHIDGISNRVTLLPYTYTFNNTTSSTVTYTGWRLSFCGLPVCSYADMRNLIPDTSKGSDMGCMFQDMGSSVGNVVLDISTWSLDTITILFHTFENVKYVNAYKANLYSNRNVGWAFLNSVAIMNNLNGIAASSSPFWTTVYYPSIYKDNWQAVISKWTTSNYIEYDRNSFLILPVSTLSFTYIEQQSDGVYPVFCSSEWTISSDSSWLKVEKIRSLGYSIKLDYNTQSTDRTGYITISSSEGKTAIVTVIQQTTYNIRYSTTDNRMINIGDTRQVFNDGYWTAFFEDSTVYLENSHFKGNTRLKTFEGSNTSLIIYNPSFEGCTELTRINFGDAKLKGADLEVFSGMFSGCKSLTDVDWNIFSDVRCNDYTGCFKNCTSLQSADLSVCDFYDASSLSVTLTSMFEGCTSLKSVIAPTTAITEYGFEMGHMFDGCKSLTEIDISSMPSIDMANMFDCCTSLKSAKVRLRSVNEELVSALAAFRNCFNLENLTIDGVENYYRLENTEEMFRGCGKITHIDLSSAVFYSVISINKMFYNCVSLKSVKLGTSCSFEYTKKTFNYHYTYLGENYKNVFDNTPEKGILYIPSNYSGDTTGILRNWDDAISNSTNQTWTYETYN